MKARKYKIDERNDIKMELKKLEITDNLGLDVEILGNVKDITRFYSESNYDPDKPTDLSIFLKRNAFSILSDIIDDFAVTDKQIIKQIMEYFVPVCDPHMSPQGLFRTEYADYMSLMLDFREADDEEYDKIIDTIYTLAGRKFDENWREYVSSICISYPETWNVELKTIVNDTVDFDKYKNSN